MPAGAATASIPAPAEDLPATDVPDDPTPDLIAGLRQLFGLESFRTGQAAVCRSVLEGRDTLAVMPTGAGKSLCFQLPALLLDGVTLVISPLIALMKDQLDGLPPAVYPKATLLNSSLDPDEVNHRLFGLANRAYKLVYIAPERLTNPGLLQALRRSGVARVVVDEAHCVSAWGHDFRPDYLSIGRALNQLGDPPVLALTATAPAPIRADIRRQLGRDFALLQTPLFRPNLHFSTVPVRDQDEKFEAIAALCQAERGSGIVYVRSRRLAETVAAVLRRRGVKASFYHAGLENQERSRVQTEFMEDRLRVIAATTAFGMGVDKANVRLVAHFGLPDSLEAYVQEAGRAGRDGRPSRCTLFYSPSDKGNLTRWLRNGRLDLDDVRQVYRQIQNQLGRGGSGYVNERAISLAGDGEDDSTRVRVAISLLERSELLRRVPEEPRRIELLPAPTDSGQRIGRLIEQYARIQEQRVEDVVDYAETMACRHARIARHFGQRVDPPCGACDRCLQEAEAPAPRPAGRLRSSGRFERAGIAGDDQPAREPHPTPAAAILDCLRTAPFPLGKTGLGRVLKGSAASPLREEETRYLGALAGLTTSAIEKLIDRLVLEGYLERYEHRERPVLALTDLGRSGPPPWDAPVDARSPRATGTSLRQAGLSPRQLGIAPSQLGRAGAIDGIDAEPPDEDTTDRFERLRAWRRRVAASENVPPYVVLHDRVLHAVAAIDPERLTIDRLALTSGFGPAKIQRYGAEIVDLLRGDLT